MDEIEKLIADSDGMNTITINKEIMYNKDKIHKVQDRRLFTIYLDKILQIYLIGFNLLQYPNRIEILNHATITHSIKKANQLIDILENKKDVK